MCNSIIRTRDGREYSCGKCEQCHNRYIQHWTFRLQNEMNISKRGVFLTLTYDYEHIPMNKGKFTLDKKHYQDFLKRLRKKLYDRKIKYVCTGEYGSEKGRPHYHLIMFDVDKDDFNDLQDTWGMGTIHLGAVEPASIAYVFKYSTKKSQKPIDWRQQPQFVSMSKGLGEQFAFNISYETNKYTREKITYMDTRTGQILKSNEVNIKDLAYYVEYDLQIIEFTRKRKIREPKKHFKNKLYTLLQMPYYQLPSTKGGNVKMSIPRFYLDAANYDKTQLTDMYKDKVQNKYDHIPLSKREVIIASERIQRENAPSVWEKRVKHAISKEKL